MGQYYAVLVEDLEGNREVYSPKVNGEFYGQKLTEHSWWYNAFVNTICHMIFKSPKRVAWVGDYSDDVGFEHYSLVWGKDATAKGVDEAQVTLWDKYLVNHTKKQYIKCNDYYLRCADGNYDNNWVLHPLSLLTCVGNGQGGGDYWSKVGEEYVGAWCEDIVSVEIEEPKDYQLLDDVVFKET